MKFKVGDKARIRKDLIPGEIYGGLYLWDNDMKLQRGKTVTITRANDYDGMCSPDYKVLENHYFWDEKMLEPVTEQL